MAITRYFYRCTGCLEVVALTDQLPMQMGYTVARCTNCERTFDYMGRTNGSGRLSHSETRCKCDDRCTSARGPLCDCACNGENHGAGMAGYVTVSVDTGAVPRVTMPDTKSRDKSLRQFREYQAQLAQVLAETDAIRARKSREYLPRPVFDRLRVLMAGLHKAHAARTHAARMRALTVMVQEHAA